MAIVLEGVRNRRGSRCLLDFGGSSIDRRGGVGMFDSSGVGFGWLLRGSMDCGMVVAVVTVVSLMV